MILCVTILAVAQSTDGTLGGSKAAPASSFPESPLVGKIGIPAG
jgi:hypothetical protein